MAVKGKPGPHVTAITRPFWEGCNRGQLLIQKCRAPGCGRCHFYPRVCCPHCGGGELVWEAASGRGRIVSFSRIHRPHHEGFYAEAPYYYIAVCLDEGPMMFSRLRNLPESETALIGREVSVVFVDDLPEQRLPFFELITESPRKTI